MQNSSIDTDIQTQHPQNHTILLGRLEFLKDSNLNDFYFSDIKCNKTFILDKERNKDLCCEEFVFLDKHVREVKGRFKKHDRWLIRDFIELCDKKNLSTLCFSHFILWIPRLEPKVPLVYDPYWIDSKEMQQKLIGEVLEPKLLNILEQLRNLTSKETRQHVKNCLLVNTTLAHRNFLEKTFKDTSVYVLPETITNRFLRRLG